MKYRKVKGKPVNDELNNPNTNLVQKLISVGYQKMEKEF
jgi:hypothetical protein